MQFRCRVRRLPTGQWSMEASDPRLGAVVVQGPSREEVRQKMRQELQYRLEYCPCTGELYSDATIELIEEDPV